jgi:hypothetical protein
LHNRKWADLFHAFEAPLYDRISAFLLLLILPAV